MKKVEMRKSVLNEISKWAERGRRLYEFREGDVVLLSDGATEVLKEGSEQLDRLAGNPNQVIGIFPIDSFIYCPSADEVFGEGNGIAESPDDWKESLQRIRIYKEVERRQVENAERILAEHNRMKQRAQEVLDNANRSFENEGGKLK